MREKSRNFPLCFAFHCLHEYHHKMEALILLHTVLIVIYLPDSLSIDVT